MQFLFFPKLFPYYLFPFLLFLSTYLDVWKRFQIYRSVYNFKDTIQYKTWRSASKKRKNNSKYLRIRITVWNICRTRVISNWHIRGLETVCLVEEMHAIGKLSHDIPVTSSWFLPFAPTTCPIRRFFPTLPRSRNRKLIPVAAGK